MAHVNIKSVKEKMAHFLKRPVAQFEDTAALRDFVAESLMLVELVIYLQEEFGVRFSQEDLQNVKTVGDLMKLFK